MVSFPKFRKGKFKSVRSGDRNDHGIEQTLKNNLKRNMHEIFWLLYQWMYKLKRRNRVIISIISSTGAAICKESVVGRCKADNTRSTSISWKSVHKISLSWVKVLNFYILLVRFRNDSYKGTASVLQILWKSRTFLSRAITGNESWINGYDHEKKQ
jgi:hypothetical protein